jgi:branched-chain amino acid transport system substrate-binding protein
MSKRLTRSVKAAVLSALAAVVITSGLSATYSVAQAARPQARATYTIGISVPYLQLKELADGIQRGVAVAVGQANAKHLVRGVTFQFEPRDDTVNGKYDGAKDSQNGRQFIHDPTVIGEVGPLNSGAAKVSIPVYNAAGLVQISPSNTNPDLTNPKFRAHYETTTATTGSPITYFRTCSTDSFQGPAGALYAKKAGVKSVFVTDNQGTYGIGLATAFKNEAKKIGLKVLGYAELDANNIASSAQSLAASIAAKKPDLVYFGGEYGAKGGAEILADDLKKDGLSKTMFMGGDGIYAADFIKGSSAGGAYGALATSVGGDPRKDPNAQAFLKAEAKMFPGKPVAAYDTYSYDAANIILNAFARAVTAGKIKVGDKMTKDKRLVIARYVAATKDYHGATGEMSFDANGDTTNREFGVYEVFGTGKNAHWGFLALAPKVTT